MSVAGGDQTSTQGETRRQECIPPVLVADDDPASRLLIRKFLAQLGLANPVLECADGGAAIAHLEASRDSDGVTPALVLLDIGMPVASGLDVLRALREHPTTKALPVVMLTGSSEMADINTAFDLGIDSYLVKPVGFDALGDVVRALRTRWALLDPDSGS